MKSDHVILEFNATGVYVRERVPFSTPSGLLSNVPKGTKVNGASIPLWAIPLIGLSRYDRRIIRAATIHDYMYETGSKKTADQVFYISLREDKLDRIRATIMFYAVKLFGRAD